LDRQYEYIFIGDFDHYGFLPYHAGECIDPMAEEGIGEWQIADSGWQIAEGRFHPSIWFL